ncbi:MAG: hypothetical protein PHW25_13870 [Zoogloea sp.]|uniref:hypothetical protein n=1 Tax=Zoogloea sp. TaxID=49181 RepID=UPI0026037DC4|nr:hypothetical protein [Zoogloea sp.]MDD3328163.1 hypothetical protein [Zoogloea sp.]
MSTQAQNTAGQPIAFVSAQALRARMHDAVNDAHLRHSFRGAMDFLMAKRAAQFPDEGELGGDWSRHCTKISGKRGNRSFVRFPS